MSIAACPQCGGFQYSTHPIVKCVSFECNPVAHSYIHPMVELEPEVKERKPREKRVSEEERRRLQWYREATQ